MEDNTKSALQSKTILTAAAISGLTMIPGVKDIVSSHPQESMSVLAGLFAGLRLITKGKVDLSLPF